MKNLFPVILVLMALLSADVNAQQNVGGEPFSFQNSLPGTLAGTRMQNFDMRIADQQDSLDNVTGAITKVGYRMTANLNLTNSGGWVVLPNGDRVWRLKIEIPNAMAGMLYFDDFYLPPGAVLYAYSPDRQQVRGGYTSINNHSSREFAIEKIFGEYMILEYYEPLAANGLSSINISHVGHIYRDISFPSPNDARGFGTSQSCQVNANCSEGNNFRDPQRSVALINSVIGGFIGICTGSLVNNVQEDCTPYFLTAYHCGDGASASNLNQWVFYFNWEAPGCSNPGSSPGANSMVGCSMKSNSNDGGGTSGSDFMLVEFNSSVPQGYNVYYAGWNAGGGGSNTGVCIHHPDGDIKKISTFSGGTFSTQWGSASGSHWAVQWSTTTNGTGVTEGGSSGSPLYDSNGRVLGTLTGGGSSCNNPSNWDLFGKTSYHWTSNGTTAATRLKDWLDPNNSGATTMNGTNFPCGVGAAPVAAFTGSPLQICPGSAVTFTDQSTGSPTSWSWSFPGGSPSTSISANPTITYNTAGTYNVTLTATNASGNDSHTETAYVAVVGANSSIPLVEGFEAANFPATNWTVVDPDSDIAFVRTTDASGYGGSTACAMMDNFDVNTNTAGTQDWLITPSFDFTSVTGAFVTFDVAYAYYSANNSDSLGVYVSTDCGATYQLVWFEGGADLATSGGPVTTEFIPTASQWRNETIDLNAFSGDNYVQIAFVNYSGWGNKLYIDNVNITNQVGPPTAEFIGSPTTVYVGQTVNFLDLSSGQPTNWLWTFQGGAPLNATTQNPAGVQYNAVGTYNVSLQVFNSAGNDLETKTAYINVIEASGCDTLSNISAGDSAIIYASGGTGGGYVSGHNGYGDIGKADKFTNYPPGTSISSVLFGFGIAEFANASSSINVRIWDDDGTNASTGSTNTPGTVLATETLLISDIATDITNGDFTEVTFTNPVMPTGDFYVGIEFGNTIAGDSVALITNTHPQSNPSTAWEKWNTNEWYVYDESDSWELLISHFIFPVLCVEESCGEVVGLDVNPITNTSARLLWDAVSGADHYEIRGRRVNTPNWVFLSIPNGAPNFKDVFGISANQTYEWQIRAFCDAAGTEIGSWSVLDSFIAICQAPDSVWTDPVTPTGARLNWTPVVGAGGYEIKGRRVGTGSLVTIAVGQVTFKDVFGLLSGFQYEWLIRAFCDQSGNTTSEFSEWDMFTTLSGARLGKEEPVLSESSAYPNPFSSEINLRGVVEEENYKVSVLNTIGEEVYVQGNVEVEAFMDLTVDLSHLNPGIYFIHIENGNKKIVERIVKQ